MDTVLAADIGNTKAKIGVIDIQNLTCKKKRTVNSSDTKIIIDTINAFLRECPPKKAYPVKISSTIKSKVMDIQSLLQSQIKTCQFEFLRYHNHLPFQSNYLKPETLGTDRIANCLFGIKKFPGRDCIIISAGTAITIDILSDKGEHLGGYILPGVHTQFKSLFANTAELPLITGTNSSYSHTFPPNSTESGIYHGIVLAQSGGISFIIKKVFELLPKDYTILACGGEWKFIKPHAGFSFIEYPDLTLIGTGLFE